MERGLLQLFVTCFGVMIGSTMFLSIFGILEKYSNSKWLNESKRGDNNE